MAELVDASDSKSGIGNNVQVRFLFWALSLTLVRLSFLPNGDSSSAIPDGLFMKKKVMRKDAFQELLIFKKINCNLTNQLWFFIKNAMRSIW